MVQQDSLVKTHRCAKGLIEEWLLYCVSASTAPNCRIHDEKGIQVSGRIKSQRDKFGIGFLLQLLLSIRTTGIWDLNCSPFSFLGEESYDALFFLLLPFHHGPPYK